LIADVLEPSTEGPMAPFYDAAAAGLISLPFCGNCGLTLELEQLVCDLCSSVAVDWRSVPPAGIVHAVTTVYRLERDLVLTDSPYHVVDVELVSGHRLVMTTVAQTATAPTVGANVTLTFRRVGKVSVLAIGG
jgi:uncharacterized OB-fold protein